MYEQLHRAINDAMNRTGGMTVGLPKCTVDASQLKHALDTLEAAGATLANPALLHAAMLRGTVPKLSWRQVCHLSGEVYNGEEAQLSEIVRLREELKAAEAKLEVVRKLPCHTITMMIFPVKDIQRYKYVNMVNHDELIAALGNPKS